MTNRLLSTRELPKVVHTLQQRELSTSTEIDHVLFIIAEYAANHISGLGARRHRPGTLGAFVSNVDLYNAQSG